MSEMRKTLTEIQRNQLIETQTLVAQARSVVQRAEMDAQRVVQLIFDAHSIPANWTAEIDQETGELVCKEPPTAAAN